MIKILTKPFPLACLILSVFMAIACASEGRVSGGEKDGEGPVVVKTTPKPGTLNYLSNEVVVYFDEYIKQKGYASEVFISPVQEQKPEISTGLKKIKIKLKDELRPSTTYVITIGTGVKDYNEGNHLDSPFTIAFSTGAVLDSLYIKGKVVDPMTGAGEEEYTILLFPAEDLVGDSIQGVRPLYASITDEDGKFKMRYLARRDYRIYAIKDIDRNYTFNLPTEKLGLAGDPFISFPDSVDRVKVTLQSTLPDFQAPMPRSAKWINEKTILVDFKEDIPFVLGKDSLSVYMTDTLGNSPELVFAFNKISGEKGKILLHTSRPKSDYSQIHFRHLIDSLGNRKDTFIVINENKINTDFEEKFVMKPEYNKENQVIEFTFTYPLRAYLNGRLIRITDTISQEVLDYENVNRDYRMDITLKEKPTKKVVLKIEFLKGIQFRTGNELDSVVTHFVKIKDPDKRGGLSGKIIDDEVPGNWKAFLKNDKGETVRTCSSKTFEFQGLKEGEYTFWLFNDADSNGVFTPGSLQPYRLPEKVFIDTEPIEVRAKWQIEDHEVKVKKSFKAVKKSSSSKKGDRKKR